MLLLEAREIAARGIAAAGPSQAAAWRDPAPMIEPELLEFLQSYEVFRLKQRRQLHGFDLVGRQSGRRRRSWPSVVGVFRHCIAAAGAQLEPEAGFVSTRIV